MDQPAAYQRLESLALFLASFYFYYHLDFSLLTFVVVLFLFDIFMIGYLFNKQIGAHIYNLGHSMTLPVLLLVIATANDYRLLTGLCLIWLAHIGVDRTFGYGLKFASGFRDTHLGRIGSKGE